MVRILLLTMLATAPAKPPDSCRGYFVTARAEEQGEWDKAPTEIEVWWENQGRRKYKRLCWEKAAIVQEKNLSPVWVLSWQTNSFTEERPNPLDLIQVLHPPLIYTPGPRIEVTREYLAITTTPVEQIQNADWQYGRAVFTKSVFSNKYRNAFEDALKDIMKRLPK